MNTKEKVLQKCAELCGGSQFVKFNDDKWSIIFAFGGKWTIEHFSGDIQINIDVNANEDSDVWPLAAQVLGIGEDAVSKDDLVVQLCAAKSREDNRIDLDAFAAGLIAMYDVIVNPKPNEA